MTPLRSAVARAISDAARQHPADTETRLDG